MKKLRHVVYAIQAIGGLMVYDLVVRLGFARTHALVAKFPVLKRRPAEQSTAGICNAVAEACVWYVKRVHCLQRSAVTTWLLRLHGVPAELVIGCRPVPVRSHAWVEVNGNVVNDRPQYQKFFRVLERF
ncbi:MAG TPA: lasso peptide biosynthesis B2 protein [Pyrinomonadaceae bacterium]|nr:lasso peptide biosynthesis B2 protein [Pyrinomonadaceae bacterium]